MKECMLGPYGGTWWPDKYVYSELAFLFWASICVLYGYFNLFIIPNAGNLEVNLRGWFNLFLIVEDVYKLNANVWGC